MKSAEEKKLKALARQYTKDGFTVFTDLAGFEPPPHYSGLTPDLVAKKGDQVILVEVVEGARGGSNRKEQVAEFARYAEEQPNVRFDLVVIRPDTAKPISPRYILKRLRGRTLRELEATSELLPRAFFVLFAVAVEDLLISAAAKKEVEVERFKELPELALYLQEKEVIAPSMVAFAKEVWELRNQVLHSGQADLSREVAQKQLARFKRLTGDYGWVYEKRMDLKEE
jgi:hypothetical protein